MSSISKFVDRLGTGLDVWNILRALGILSGGAVTGVLSTTVNAINQFGWFGWWVAALGGACLTAAIFSLASLFALRQAQTKAIQGWKTETDGINPLETSFHRKRIKIADLAHPFKNNIEGKTFTECELVGPANIAVVSHCSFKDMGFINCDLVPTKPSTFIQNAIALNHVQMVGGSIMGATVYLHPSMLPMLESMTPSYVSLTGVPEIDARSVKNLPSAQSQA